MDIITAIMLAFSSPAPNSMPPACNADIMPFATAKWCHSQAFGRTFGSEGGSDSSGESSDGGESTTE
jgi:hypothetical protein